MATAKPVKKSKLAGKKLEKKQTLMALQPLTRTVTLTRSKFGL